MDVALSADGEGTLLQYRYQVTGGSASNLDSLAEPLDRVQLSQLRRSQQYLLQYPQPIN